jgi:hypothetical protein
MYLIVTSPSDRPIRMAVIRQQQAAAAAGDFANATPAGLLGLRART